MKIKAAIFDIDKTITTQDTFFLFFKFLMTGFRPVVCLKLLYFFAVTRVFKTDRIAVKAVVLELLNGMSEDQARDVCVSFIESKFKNIISEKAMASIAQHRQEGYRILLISASLDVYLKYIDRCLDFDWLICTKTKFSKGNNYIDGKNCYGAEKIERLNEYLDEEGLELDYETSYFYSDHHSDLPLLELVGHPCVVNGNAKLLALAKKNQWATFDWA